MPLAMASSSSPPPQTRSPRPASSSSASSSSSSRAPLLPLPLSPSTSLGPFVLGSSLYTTLLYLRQTTGPSANLHPKVEVVFDRQDPTAGGAILIRPMKQLSLAFAHGNVAREGAARGGPRLRMIVLDFDARGRESGQTIHASKEESSKEAGKRRLDLTYKGQKCHVGQIGATSTNSTSLTRGTIQQLFGPTYPARKYLPGDGLHEGLAGASSSSSSKIERSLQSATEQWILSYEGMAFLFDASGPDQADLTKAAKPVRMVVFNGSDPLKPNDVRWPLAGGSSDVSKIFESHLPDSSGRRHGQWEDLASSGVICTKATIRPHQSLRLELIRPPYPAPGSLSSTTATVLLTLRSTTQQDVLLDLGSPQKTWSKPGSGVTAANGNENGVDLSNAVNPPPDEFWSYPSLGIDLLFTSHEPTGDEDEASATILSKMVVHSDIPGSASWGRYEFCPWTIEAPDQGDGGSERRRDRDASETREDSKPASTRPAAASDLKKIDSSTPLSQVKTFLSKHHAPDETTNDSTQAQEPSSPTVTRSSKETMDLDRSADPLEFKGLLVLDVRTQLRGWKGLIGEILPMRKGTSDQKEDGKEEGTITTWTIV